VRRSTYRPDPWRRAEWLVGGCGVVCAGIMLVTGGYDPLLLHPSLYPLVWPDLPLLPLAAILVGVLPAWLAPRPERASVRRSTQLQAVAA
jgi:energy-coupling factor transport system permease protein